MTQTDAPGVLRRMIGSTAPAQAEVPITAARAIRLATMRAATDAVGLTVQISGVGEQVHTLDPLLTELTDDLLMISVHRDGVAIGVLACDAALVAAVVEMQTTGKISSQAPDPRKLTHTDTLMVSPVLERLLFELGQTLPRTALDGWLDDAVLGPRFDVVRAVGMALSDQSYRLVNVTMEFEGSDRSGQFFLALPTLATPTLTADAGVQGATQDWALHFQAAVKAAPAQLDAQLHALTLPAARLSNLQVGDVLPMLGCTLGSIKLVLPGGRTFARGRLGHVGGQKAVRVAGLQTPLIALAEFELAANLTTPDYMPQPQLGTDAAHGPTLESTQTAKSLETDL